MSSLGGINYEADQMKQPLPPVLTPAIVAAKPPEIPLVPGDAKLYKSGVPSCRHIFKNGVVAHFIHGRFSTDKPEQIAELDAEIAFGTPHIYFDLAEPTAKAVENAMMENLKGHFYRQFIAEQEMARASENKDGGTYEPGKLIPTSTSDIASTAAGGGPSTVPKGISKLSMLAAPK